MTVLRALHVHWVRNDGIEPTKLVPKALLLLQIVAYTLWLKAVNIFSRRPITGSCDVDISITTYGARTRRVWRTLETIASGTLLPRSIVLWHEDESLVRNPPRPLRRLQRRGLKLRHCKDFGPHKKYFPYVTIEPLERPLVTADDDVLYPRNWLAGLVSVYRPDEVAAHRARVMGDGPYASWPLCVTAESSYNLISMGVSGVIYPPKVLEALRARGDSFMAVCPRADDLWLHYAAVASGIRTRQVSAIPAKWWPVRPKERGLWHENLAGGGNDAVAGTVAQAWQEDGVRGNRGELLRRRDDTADSLYDIGEVLDNQSHP